MPIASNRFLNRFLHGERVIVVANREPYIHEHSANGEIVVRHPASGLVTAMEPVLRACSGVWIAHGAGDADRETVDRHNRVRVPPGEESYSIRRIWLSEEEEAGYYYGIANEGLWPLCHVAHVRPVFRANDWEYYRSVNEKFAHAVVQEVDSDDPIVLVQDYHFALAPALIRQRLPKATVLMFWHIPWPAAERFGICPYRHEIIEGMLGSSILGFHTQLHCNNFLECVDRFLESRIDREEHAVVQKGRKNAGAPVSDLCRLAREVAGRAPAPPTSAAKPCGATSACVATPCSASGIDRLDYTKGVEERLLAVERLLERFPEYRGRFTFVQLAAPSRTKIDKYHELNDRVEAITQQVNERFGTRTYKPIVLLRAHHEPPTVYRFYRAANFCYVSSLHDGMNLVAKEFVAARNDEAGCIDSSASSRAQRAN
ncbi:MAG: trehalose-6-phosphate synthase [Acidobacteriota bacterium]